MSTPQSHGFFIEGLRVVGEGRQTAEIELTDGLNVISGASDTGKSYVLDAIDYALGASQPPDAIPESRGYDRVELDLRVRKDASRVSVHRSLAGGSILLRRASAEGTNWEETTVSAKHAADDRASLSHVLLDLSGFTDISVRVNKQGKTRSLSFRDIAHLTVIDEQRIISETPPHLSGQYILPTVEAEVFRTLVTGATLPKPVKARPHTSPAQYRAQMELVGSWLDDISKSLARRNPGGFPVDTELTTLEREFVELNESFERNSEALRALDVEMAKAIRDLREVDSRLTTVYGLSARFGLLDQHYGASVSRLNAIAEAGSLLLEFPTAPCLVCGAAPDGQRSSEISKPFRPAEVSEAALAEARKSQLLRKGLATTLSELQAESTELAARATALRSQIETGRERVEKELQPRTALAADTIRKMAERRSELLSIKAETARLELLKRQHGELERRSKSKHATADALLPAESTTAEMDAFATTVQELLEKWNYPSLGRVVFAEKGQDLIIAGQPRGSHGKGVRAVTCAAFIVGLMRHCSKTGLPHPRVVVLDTPLAVYREPDAPKQADDNSLLVAGVKEAFFRSLAAGDGFGQVIVLENEDPPADLPDSVTTHHFSKSSTGRYGFYPVQAPHLEL